MIVVRLRGRLGNQMFQYATGRSLAERHGTELVLDSSGILQAGGPNDSIRNELELFGLPERVCPVWEVARVPNPSPVVRTLQRLRPSRRRFVEVVAEELSSNAFQPAVLTASAHAYLIGYWQFEDYFVDHAPAIRRAFTFPPLPRKGERLAETIRGGLAVSVHVRRGDYLEHGKLGFLDAGYYERAVAEVAGRAGAEIRIFVFSDDPDWCRENLHFAHETTVVDSAAERDRSWEDMCLMSLCRHHVISNSTYSWWGAWLNPSSSKVVVAPKRWVMDAKRAGDPVPSHWLRV